MKLPIDGLQEVKPPQKPNDQPIPIMVGQKVRLPNGKKGIVTEVTGDLNNGGTCKVEEIE